MTEQDATDADEVADRADEQAGDAQAETDGPDGGSGSEAAEDSTADDEAPDTTVEAVLESADVTADAEDVDPGDELVDDVAAADPQTVAASLVALRDRVASLSADLADRDEEVEDLESRLARKQADFQNYKKRQEKRLEEEKARATEDLVTRLLDVRDNLTRALDQDEDADIRPGVESTLRQFEDELEKENVEIVEPDPGDPTDPQRHEVLMRVESDQPEDTVADVHRPGYEMAGKVLRPAQVTVSEGPDDDEAESDGGEDDAASGSDAEGETDAE